MESGDFFGSETSTTLEAATEVRIEYAGDDGAVTVLKEGLALEQGEVIDTAVMNVASLRRFYAEQAWPKMLRELKRL